MSFSELDNFEIDMEIAESCMDEEVSSNIIDEDTQHGSDYKVSLGLKSGITNNDYHSSPGISSSQLKPALKSMELYHESYLGNVPFKETEAMRLGTAVHKLTLEALDFPNEIAVSKKFGRTNAAKEEKEEFYAANKGKTIITHEQYDKCRGMRDSLMGLNEIQYIFQDGEPELSGYYKDHAAVRNESTYMLCKYRPDWRTDWCIADVKSTTNVSADAFSKTINEFFYHLSAAHYLEGDRVLEGTDHRQFLFLCVEPEYPYEAAIYRLGQESLELGENLRRMVLPKIKQGRETKNWPRINDGISQEIEVPAYALNKLRELKT
jgi:exodeoxyribonuclease VIII